MGRRIGRRREFESAVCIHARSMGYQVTLTLLGHVSRALAMKTRNVTAFIWNLHARTCVRHYGMAFWICFYGVTVPHVRVRVYSINTEQGKASVMLVLFFKGQLQHSSFLTGARSFGGLSIVRSGRCS